MKTNKLLTNKNRSMTKSWLVVWFALAMGLAGCSSQVADVVPVSGKITYKGAACDGALVVFHPSESGRLNDPKPVGITDADGNYNLTTFAQNDGAAPGQYGVTVVWNAPAKDARISLSGEGSPSGPDKLSGRYGNPASPKLKAKVESTSPNEINFDLE
jgi:hypothetical protein